MCFYTRFSVYDNDKECKEKHNSRTRPYIQSQKYDYDGDERDKRRGHQRVNINIQQIFCGAR